MDTTGLDRSRELLTLCNGRSGWAHYWRKDPVQSAWYPAGRPARVPPSWMETDLYFSVNSVSADNPRGPTHRVQNAHVRQVHVIYADLDGDGTSMPLAPSVTVHSGRGRHCYWLLAQPIDASMATDLQRRWVHYVGGDPAAVDLARVLRVVGSTNSKNGATVTVEVWQPDRRYSAEQLAGAIGDAGPCPVRAYEAHDRFQHALTVKGADDIVSAILRSRQAGEFTALYNGDHGYRSHSEADAALLRLVAWWARGDTGVMLAVWQSSALWRPDRCCESYVTRTLAHGLSGMR